MEDIQPVTLSEQDRNWLDGLPFDVALPKILKAHYNERCATCGWFIGNHSLRRAKQCLVTLWNKEDR